VGDFERHEASALPQSLRLLNRNGRAGRRNRGDRVDVFAAIQVWQDRINSGSPQLDCGKCAARYRRLYWCRAEIGWLPGLLRQGKSQFSRGARHFEARVHTVARGANHFGPRLRTTFMPLEFLTFKLTA